MLQEDWLKCISDIQFHINFRLTSVLDILFLYSQDIRPFKSSFWSAILQIKPDKIY